MSTCQYELNCWPCYRRHDSLSQLVPWSMTANRINSVEIFILSWNSNVFFQGIVFVPFCSDTILTAADDGTFWLCRCCNLAWNMERPLRICSVSVTLNINEKSNSQKIIVYLSLRFISCCSLEFLFFLLESWSLRCHWSDRITWCGPLHTPSSWTGFSEFEGRSSHQRCVQHLCQSWWCACQMLND